ncbi:hypothetical protein ARMGADRAFT_805248 [Armillaria gallica]|uniref:Uncharacterized protein n=1 Tax=Armillaria gallica TaxID=47427 RepID=A0A2H3DK28_ARMGA|nr:hypothetical protein ARMGADRAFT_805248 [Armillaria gallica]
MKGAGSWWYLVKRGAVQRSAQRNMIGSTWRFSFCTAACFDPFDIFFSIDDWILPGKSWCRLNACLYLRYGLAVGPISLYCLPVLLSS